LWLRERPHFVYAIVFIFFLLLHSFIFRDVIAAIPDIVSGDASIVREELVPFFDFGKQFWSDNTSELTGSDEIRVNYSFWTSWVRYNGVLPFALVLLNAISATILFHAFYMVGRRFFASRRLVVVLASLLAAFLIHFILLYSKVTHFYTLIFGFSMFAWSLSLVLEQLFFAKNLQKRNIILVSLVVLLNPAIHYHIMFYFTFALLVLLQLGFVYVLHRSSIKTYLKKNFAYIGIVTAASLVPYVIYIMITTGSSASSVSVDIPVNYWMIYYSSLALPSLLSLDTAAQIDMFRYGAYIIPSPRIVGMMALFVIISIFLMRQWTRIQLAKRVFLLILFIAMLLSMWMAWGYSEDNIFSFHKLVGAVAMWLIEQGNVVAQLLGKGVAVFINVLRFPHRFQFIYFYLIGLLLVVGLVWIYEKLRQKRSALVAASLIVLLALTPVLMARDYFSVLTSGNFANFLEPYYISNDLKNIRRDLAKQDNDKVMILPSLENGRDVIADGKRYGFIDKFLIYYLNQPTLYYGTGGDPKSKLAAYMIYRAINDGENWWDEVLVNNLHVTHVVAAKHSKVREVGYAYMSGVDAKILAALDKSDKLEKVHDGPDFALYKTVTPPSDQQVMLDVGWDNLARRLEDETSGQSVTFPLQLSELMKRGTETLQLVTDSPERSFYNIYGASGKSKTFYPDATQLAFSKDFVASSIYTNSALSLETLDQANDNYNYTKERIPNFLNFLYPQFIGVAPSKKQLTAQISVPETGKYRLLLHGASREDRIIGAVDDEGILMEKVSDDRGKHRDYVDMTYFYVDVELEKGTHQMVMHNPGGSGLIGESLQLIPNDQIPGDFHNVKSSDIQITQGEKEGRYDVTLQKGGQ
jgi:hypothetical protein